MESGRSHGGVMRGGPGGKKMRKRKELDALVGGVGVKRANGGGVKRAGSGGVSPQDQLLSESTGEEDYWSLAKGGSEPKRKIHYNSPTGKSRIRACAALLRLCTILLVMASVVATITVMWLFIDIKEQTTYLRSQLDQVTAGNQEIPDAIQRCHTLTKQLEQNQTLIIIQLQQVAQKLTDFSNMIRGIESGLSSVKKKLNDTPDLASIPKTFQELIDSVAKFGGQLADFNVTTMNEQKKISDQIDNINKNLSLCNILQEELQNVKNDSYRKIIQSSENKSEALFQSIINYITPNISSLNSTVWKKIDGIIKDHRETQDTINNFKVHLETVHQEEQDLHKQVLNDINKKTAPLLAAVENCKHDSDLKMELLRNLKHQVTNCACTGENSTDYLQHLSTSPGAESIKKEIS